MNESPRTAEKEGPEFLNNFVHYLPGGRYRSYYGKDQEKDKIISAIDELLKNEFPDLDPKVIHEDVEKCSKLLEQAINFDNALTTTERESNVDEIKELGEKLDNTLRPLLNRMMELGFDWKRLVE